MLVFFWNFILLIVSLGVLIIVHEFGHFLFARLFGVMIERFSIGFGPTLLSWHDKRGIEYVIAAVPLGGYVKMFDEQEINNTVSSKSLCNIFKYKPIWQRFIIICAGPIFNFFLSIFFYWFIFMIGISNYKPIIGDVIPNSIIDQAKISSGMELKSIDNIKTPDWDSARFQFISKIGKNKVDINLMKIGSTNIEKKTLNLRNWLFKIDEQQDPLIALGIIPDLYIVPIITKIESESAAMKAGLKIGDKIITINGKRVDNLQLLATKIKHSPEKKINFFIKRQNDMCNITLTPNSKLTSKTKIEGFAGLSLKIIPLSSEYRTFQQFRPLSALHKSIEKTCIFIKFTVNMLGKFIVGDIKLNSLSGPISIAQGIKTSAEHGLTYYFAFLALISINLGVINLFPIPVLDGGHLLFLIIEKIRGKQLSEQVQNFSFRIGSILLLFLTGLAILNDFFKL